MKKLLANEIRNIWIKFFKSKEHFFVESASLIPIDDPSLLWINSGVATLKPYFEGKLNPPCNRLVNSQKCIRTNDIENVGITSRHQTMFEMLGNFSIGDYFKKEAIKFAWELLTDKKWFDIDQNKLYITIFENDDEAYKIWHEIVGVPSDRIFKGSRDTNFWDVGKGPCGPNTEIFFDRGQKYDPKNIGIDLLKNDIENDRYIEIWNIVFSQFNNDGNGNYLELPKKNIDTGAGFERLVSIFQDVPTNFDSDLFLPIIQQIEEIINFKFKYNSEAYFSKNNEQAKINVSFKVISDHIRAVVFAIADGVYPSNKERGYIIRRLIRRAMVYGRKIGIEGIFLHKLVDVVVSCMEYFYPYLKKEKERICEIILDEENKFLLTLSKGFTLLTNWLNEKKEITGKDCFLLFESFGFPIELTTELIEEYNKTNKKEIFVNINEFNCLLESSKEISRLSRVNVDAWKSSVEEFKNITIKSEFVGYEQTECNAEIVCIYKQNKNVKSIKNEFGYIILDKTPFFATKGGQEHDCGILISSDKKISKVLDVEVIKNKQNIHYVNVEGELKIGDKVQAKIDLNKRLYTMKNHSGTHLIHSAIKYILGNDCHQIGSSNNENGLRIDISFKRTPNEDEILKIQKLVNENIKKNHKLEIYLTNLKTAINKYNAIALFSEKYDNVVRVVKFGDFSSELCGGTHVKETSDIEDFLITKVESKGSGVIRFIAITSKKHVYEYVNNFFIKKLNSLQSQFQELEKWKNQLNLKQLNNNEILLLTNLYKKIKECKIDQKNIKLISQLEDEFRILFKKVEIMIQKINSEKIIKLYLDYDVVKNEDHHFLEIKTNEFDFKMLKMLSDSWNNIWDDLILHLIDEKNMIYLISVGKKISDKYSAIDLFKNVNKYKLKGGGNNQLAQGKIISIVK